MIYLTTGANGSGKTLLTLKDVREQQLKENRPVYYHGFEIEPVKAAEFGWQEFEPKKWQDLPDGSICIMDECQNEFPIRRSGSEVPDYINAIAQFRRKRGFDFWMISPHPSLIDVFVRRLIDKPSWHRHLKRAFGSDLVSVLEFSSPDMKCEEPGAGSRGEVTMRPYPKEVYSWYKSASLHTGKKKIPRAVFVVIVCALAVPAALWFAYSSVNSNVLKKKENQDISVKNDSPTSENGISPRNSHQLVKVSADDYLTLRKPRLNDFPHTAPVFDDVVKPVHAPYPAACIKMGNSCKCYSQQATLMQVSGEVCQQIVMQGFFIEWQQAQPTVSNQPLKTTFVPPAQAQAPPVINVNLPQQSQQRQVSQWSEGLAARNAEVRSSFDR